MSNLLVKRSNLFDLMDEVLLNKQGFFSFKSQLKEREDHFQLDLELPGLEKTDIDLSFDDQGNLIVQAEKKLLKDETNERVVFSEFREFKAKRGFYFGEVVKKNEVSAKYENGILSIKLPKAKKEENSHKIEIL